MIVWILVILSFLLLLYTYAGYPALLALVRRGRKSGELRGDESVRSVSVVISVFNAEQAIEERIRNLLDQDGVPADYEIVIGSDGSTDGTVAAVQAIGDPRVRVVSFETNRGKAAVLVGTALSEADPGHASVFAERADVYRGELGDLSHWAVRMVMEIPAEKRTIVTLHDAFGYFGNSFRTETYSLLGFTPTAGYTEEDVDRLARELVRRGIEVIFAEAGAPSGPLQELQQAARAHGHELRLGGTLYADALGAPGTPADNYLGMFRHNISTYAEAMK